MMRQFQFLTSIFALLVLCGEGRAGDKEDVLARAAEGYAAINAGDVDAMEAFLFTPISRFEVDGGLLRTLSVSDQAVRVRELKGAFAAGLKINVQTFHENAEVYDNTAVVTCYERVNINPPEGEPVNDTRRVTIVMVKENGNWNGVHVHLSYLKPVNPE